jgi:hypothetical protein
MIIEFWKTNENPITCYHSKPYVNIGNSIPMTRDTLRDAIESHYCGTSNGISWNTLAL